MRFSYKQVSFFSIVFSFPLNPIFVVTIIKWLLSWLIWKWLCVLSVVDDYSNKGDSVHREVMLWYYSHGCICSLKITIAYKVRGDAHLSLQSFLTASWFAYSSDLCFLGKMTLEIILHLRHFCRGLFSVYVLYINPGSNFFVNIVETVEIIYMQCRSSLTLLPTFA